MTFLSLLQFIFTIRTLSHSQNIGDHTVNLDIVHHAREEQLLHEVRLQAGDGGQEKQELGKPARVSLIILVKPLKTCQDTVSHRFCCFLQILRTLVCKI